MTLLPLFNDQTNYFMDYEEKILPFTAEDEVLFQKQLKIYYIVGVIFLAILGGILFSITQIGGGGDWIGYVFVGIFLIVFVGALGYIAFKVSKDATEKRKKVIRGQIEDKIHETRTSNSSSRSGSTSHYYYFLIGGNRIAVDQTEYGRFHQQERVEIHQTLHAELILRIHSLEPADSPILRQAELARTDFRERFAALRRRNHPLTEWVDGGRTQPVNLRPEQLTRLRLQRNNSTFWRALWAVVIGVIVYFVSDMLVGLLMIMGVDPGVGRVIGFGLRGLIAFLLARWGSKPWRTYQADIAAGEAQVFTGTITDKYIHNRNGTLYHHLYVEGRQLSTTAELYQAVDRDDRVAVTFSPQSELIWEIRKV